MKLKLWPKLKAKTKILFQADYKNSLGNKLVTPVLIIRLNTMKNYFSGNR